MIDLTKITTENRNIETMDIDIVSTLDMVKMINQQDKQVAIAVSNAFNEIAKVIDEGVKAIKNNGRIIYFGAGTSGRLGILDASEIFPTFGESNWFIALIAGGKRAIVTPMENAEDNRKLIEEDLKNINVTKEDLLIGISASGRTPYVLHGLEIGNELGAKTSSISTSKGAVISKEATIAIEVITGPETITGSTRMKSGTAQKMILNMISTGIMIKLGKTYSNLMVDMKATNEKLVVRGQNMISKIVNISLDAAKALYEKSGRSVKVAVVMHEKNVNFKEAKNILKNNNNFLRKSIV